MYNLHVHVDRTIVQYRTISYNSTFKKIYHDTFANLVRVPDTTLESTPVRVNVLLSSSTSNSTRTCTIFLK